jgi:hypothetical protein
MFFRSRRCWGGLGSSLPTVVAGERGAELVESAFVLPILLMLLLGIIWMGRGYMIYETITRAAREGTRYEVLPNCASCGNVPLDPPSSSCLDTSSGTFQGYIAPVLQAANLDPNRVTNYCPKTQWLNTGDDPQACGVVISFTYPAAMAIPFTSLNATTINISTEVQMRNENQPASIAGAAPLCP